MKKTKGISAALITTKGTNMKKRHFITGIAAALFAAICIGLYAFANPSKPELFTGINGEKISVYTNSGFKQANAPTENETVNAGDIIEFKGSKEIVIGVSEDGRFITIPFEDSQAEK